LRPIIFLFSTKAKKSCFVVHSVEDISSPVLSTLHETPFGSRICRLYSLAGRPGWLELRRAKRPILRTALPATTTSNEHDRERPGIAQSPGPFGRADASLPAWLSLLLQSARARSARGRTRYTNLGARVQGSRRSWRLTGPSLGRRARGAI
jgi:hypothetical protein